jgi:hypothetical protein
MSSHPGPGQPGRKPEEMIRQIAAQSASRVREGHRLPPGDSGIQDI